jgi:hypothetical protein
MRFIATVLIGCALGVSSVTATRDLILADQQKADAITTVVRCCQCVVVWSGAACFIAVAALTRAPL